MTGVSIDAVQVEAQQYLAAATIGDTSILVAGPVDEAPSAADTHYILGKLFEIATERAQPADPTPDRAMTDGGFDISPDELQNRKNSWSSTDPDEQKRCPECGSVSLYPKNETAAGKDREHEEPYFCRGCGSHVEPDGPTALADGGEPRCHTLTGNGSIPPGYEPTAADMEGDRE